MKIIWLKQGLTDLKTPIFLKKSEFLRKVGLDTLESGKIDENLLADRLTKIKHKVVLYDEQKRELELQIDDNASTEYIPFEYIKEAMINFHQLLEKAPAPDKKMLLQLLIKRITITDRKKIDAIEIEFNEALQKHLLNIKGESSNNEDSPSFYAFKIAI